MTRTEIINSLIEKNGYQKYLEIGVRDYYTNCDKIKCNFKHAVDPFPENKCDYVMTSDDFFLNLDDEFKYDIIFIDGLHLTEQVDKDIDNSIKHLSDNGCIVIHDCLPIQEENQFRNPVISQWTGDVWKSIVKIRSSKNDVLVRVVNTDWGCGIVKKSSNLELIDVNIESLDWNWFSQNYAKYIDIITIDEFKKNYL